MRTERDWPQLRVRDITPKTNMDWRERATTLYGCYEQNAIIWDDITPGPYEGMARAFGFLSGGYEKAHWYIPALDTLMSRTDSHIEAAMLGGFVIALGAEHGIYVSAQEDHRAFGVTYEEAWRFRSKGTLPEHDPDRRILHIEPQKRVGQYIVDFLVTLPTGNPDPNLAIKTIVECDGHDYHERTKEQAMRDRKRDRELQGPMTLVLRYTGSEIWKDAWDCAMDVLRKSVDLEYEDGLSRNTPRQVRDA